MVNLVAFTFGFRDVDITLVTLLSGKGIGLVTVVLLLGIVTGSPLKLLKLNEGLLLLENTDVFPSGPVYPENNPCVGPVGPVGPVEPVTVADCILIYYLLYTI
jgi:hypothetical protein